MPESENGERERAWVQERIENHDIRCKQQAETIRFRCRVGKEKLEEIIDYTTILDSLENEDGNEGVWKFSEILDHEGPIKPNSPKYRGSTWNLKVSWDNGEVTWVPMKNILDRTLFTTNDNDRLVTSTAG